MNGLIGDIMNYRLRVGAFVSAIAILGSGCALTPDGAVPPTVQTLQSTDEFTFIGDRDESRPATQIEWWSEIAGAGLGASVERLRTHNFDLIEAAERVTQAELRARQSRGSRLPSVGADAGGSYGRGPVAPSGFAWDDSYSGGLTASFDTDIFGQLRARARSAALTAEATRLNFLATEQQLVAVMTQSWVNAATLQRRLDLANEIADSYRVTYTLTDERYDTGSRNTSASDVQIARQNLEAALADIPDLETDRKSVV